MTTTTSDPRKERLVLAVDHSVSQALKVDDDDNDGWTASPEFVFALCETLAILVGDSLQNDLIAFALHAKRKTVTVEDVQLAARKSPALSKRIGRYITDSVTASKKPRKSKTSAMTTSSSKKQNKTNNIGEDDPEEEDEDDDLYEDDDIFANATRHRRGGDDDTLEDNCDRDPDDLFAD